jgi:hypothetical protein
VGRAILRLRIPDRHAVLMVNVITLPGMARPAAVAVCADHAHVTARWLTRTMVINRVVAVEPPRTIRCAVCQAARDAAPAMATGGRLSRAGSHALP